MTDWSQESTSTDLVL